MPYFAIIRGGPKYSNIIAQELRVLGGKVDVVHWSQYFPNPHNLTLPNWDLVYLRIGGCIRITFMLISQLDILGYKLVNKPQAIFRTNNKFLGAILAGKVMKVPETYLIGKKIEDFQKIPDKLSYPFVMKPILSLGGRGVEKIENKKQLDQYVNKLTKRELVGYPVYVQKFIDYDKLVRVVMVGSEVIDAAFDEPDEGWKCSVCINPNVKPYPIDDKLKGIALKVKKITGQEICMLDIFEKDGEYIFNEINNQCDLSLMQQATGVNHAKKIAEYLFSKLKNSQYENQGS